MAWFWVLELAQEVETGTFIPHLFCPDFLPTHLSANPSAQLPTRPSVCLPICCWLPVFLPSSFLACLPVSLSVCPSVHSSICLPVRPSVHLSVCPPARPSVQLSVRSSVRLPLCLSLLFLADKILVKRSKSDASIERERERELCARETVCMCVVRERERDRQTNSVFTYV
jgi:hypothetical protein